MRYQGGVQSNPQSRNSLTEKINHQKQLGFSFWAVIHKTTNELIGLAGLYSMSPNQMDLGWRLNKDFWNQKCATE